MILQPFRKVIEASGNMSYDMSLGAWNTIRFRREFVCEFPELNNKSVNTMYKVVIYRSYELLAKEIEDIVRNKKPLPVLLFFEQENGLH